jgi:hypothetical protein
MQLALSVRSLNKTYRSGAGSRAVAIPALRDVTLDVAAGEIRRGESSCGPSIGGCGPRWNANSVRAPSPSTAAAGGGDRAVHPDQPHLRREGIQEEHARPDLRAARARSRWRSARCFGSSARPDRVSREEAAQENGLASLAGQGVACCLRTTWNAVPEKVLSPTRSHRLALAATAVKVIFSTKVSEFGWVKLTELPV